MSDPNKYTVGWICAITTESVAAQLFLDEKHDGPEYVATSDNNDYTLGKVGKHNVVIAVFPDGEYGVSSATAVAKDLQHSFLNVRIVLMVGIAGGAPGPKNDIRLGDIVVSSPRNGKPSVLQYDFGKAIQGQEFKQTGYLSLPPSVLRTAVSGLRAQYEVDCGHQLEEAIDGVLKKKSRLQKKYGRPLQSTDRLYKSEVTHPLASEDSCAVLCGDDPSTLIPRHERGEDEDTLAIHYGLIASGDKLMKDAVVRDKFAKENDVLCFEMEAAGLMDQCPCLVIRGICDYSDTHKNKEWQGYAAMAAAAYAKDLLYRIHPKKVEEEKKFSEALSGLQDIAEQHKAISEEHLSVQKGIFRQRLAGKQEECLQLFRLTASDKNATYEWYKSRVEDRLEGTCRWFLTHPRFNEWLKQKSGSLLVSADPGCGKSVLAKYLIDHGLKSGSNNAEGNLLPTICYFFFQDQDQNTVRQALCALLHQLLSQLPSLIRHAVEEYDINGRALIHTTESLWKILKAVGDDPEAGSVVLVLDALDECAEGERRDLIKRLNDFLHGNRRGVRRVKCLLTSRPYEIILSEFQEMLHGFPYIRIPGEEESETINQEVNLVINHRTNQLARMKRLPDEVKYHLNQKLLSIPHATYLWIYLVFDYLKEEDFKKTVKGVDSTMAKLPRSVNQAYEKILSKSKDHPMVRKALTIIFAASRPLTLAEMNAAVNTDRNTLSIEDLDLEGEEDFKSRLRSWCGLFVSIHNGKIYFLHQTAREFLQESTLAAIVPVEPERWQQSIITQEAHALLMEICQIYLIITVWKFGSHFLDVKQVNQCLRELTFLRYSAQYWSLHLRESNIDNTAHLESILETTTLTHLSRQLNQLSETLGRCYRQSRNIDELWIASGLAELTISITPKGSPDLIEHMSNFSIQLASRYERLGPSDDIRHSIKAGIIVFCAHESRPEYTAMMNNIVKWPQMRFSEWINTVDLGQAIKFTRMVSESIPDGYYSRAGCLNSLGSLLRLRYLLTGTIMYLDEAVIIVKEAIECTHGNDPSYSEYSNNYMRILGDQFSSLDWRSHLRLTAYIAGNSLYTVPYVHLDLAQYLRNLEDILAGPQEKPL